MSNKTINIDGEVELVEVFKARVEQYDRDIRVFGKYRLSYEEAEKDGAAWIQAGIASSFSLDKTYFSTSLWETISEEQEKPKR